MDIPEQRGQSNGAARGPGVRALSREPGAPYPPEKKRRNEGKKKEKKTERKKKKERKSEGVRIGRGLQAVPKLTVKSFN